MGDNLDLPDRNGVRTPMQWDKSINAGFTTGKPYMELVEGRLGYQHINVASQLADKNSLFQSIRRMVNIRKQHPALGRGAMEWVITDNPSFAVYTRRYHDDDLLIINNLGSTAQSISLPFELHGDYVDLISNEVQTIGSLVTLQPYTYLWLKRK
jgi:maltose alpha-D-glucosyltransferase/alpha-amylase